jgi:CHAT domain-containing protein/tetratricopeptide (TPR) repeat protein
LAGRAWLKMTVKPLIVIISVAIIVVIIALLFQSRPSQLPPLLLGRIAQLNTEAESLSISCEYDSSLSIYNCALKLANDSPENLDSAIALVYSKMGCCYSAKHDYDRADSCWSRAITIRETMALCPQSELADDLKRLGEVCIFIGQMDRAKTVLERALAIEKGLYGENSRKSVGCLNELAALSRKSGNLQEAKAIRLEGLKILEESHDADSLDEGILKQLSDQYGLLRKYSEAARYQRDLIKLVVQKHGMNSRQAAETLRDLSGSLFSLNEKSEAMSILLQAYHLSERTLGRQHPITAYILGSLGYNSRILSDYVKAESLQIQTIALYEKMPEYHDEFANSLIELGSIYAGLAQYDKARTFLKRAETLVRLQSQLPSSLLAKILNRYGNIAMDLGRLSEAESLYTESLRMRVFVEGPVGSSNAEACNNLGSVSLLLNKYDEAEEYFAKALKLREDEFGSNYAYLDYSLIGLGNVDNAIGRFPKAMSVFERAARICRRSYRPDHEHFAWIAEGEGDLYRGLRKYKEADSCYQKAVLILTKKFGKSHPSLIPLLEKRALLYGSKGDLPRVLVAYRQLLQTRQSFLFNVFVYLPEEQQLSFLHENPMIVYSLLSLALLHNKPEISSLAMEMVLRGKAAALDAATTEKRSAHCSPNADTHQALKSRFRVCSTISGLTLASWKTCIPDLYRDSLRMLRQVKDSLDIELGNCSNFADDIISRRVTVRQVAKALPPNSRLLEYIWYVPYDFSVAGPDSVQEGKPRFVALTLNNQGETRIRDLGPAAIIDSLILVVRKTLYEQGTLRQYYLPEESKEQLADVSRRLYELVWSPIKEDLRGCDRVLIAPDGQLNLLPFEILPDIRNKYVVENYRISYLSSGRDLISPERMSENTGLAVLLSNPSFGLSRMESPRMDSGQPRDIFQKASLQFGQSRGLSGALALRFDPLPQTQPEVKAVRQALEAERKSAIVSLTGDSATEENLYTYAKSPRILHLATHGFFLEDKTPPAEENMESSLIGSGLAMAGANRMALKGAMEADSSDGILTALEVSGMDLNGTDIAFLSACETAVGDVRNGEGVFGLRRAFQIAGAKSLVMSLWKVPDKVTRELVTCFYSYWLGGMTKSEALRRSTLRILESHREEDGTSNPFYWGAFVLSGNPN